MRSTIPALALATGLAMAAAPALATSVTDSETNSTLAAWSSLAVQDLDNQRGGTETDPAPSEIILQSNSSEQVGLNENNLVYNSGDWDTGAIYGATITGNHGFTSVFQNTGNFVNFNATTNVNVNF